MSFCTHSSDCVNYRYCLQDRTGLGDDMPNTFGNSVTAVNKIYNKTI